MEGRLPRVMRNALDTGTWRNPGQELLRSLFSSRVPGLSELKLFDSLAHMNGVAQQIGRGDIIDNSDFCMVAKRSELKGADDTRLVFEDSLFIGGSIFPGDDVLVAVDLTEGDDPQVRVLDWSRPVPFRWVPVGALSWLVSGLK